MKHSNLLTDTKIWNIYIDKLKDDPGRISWVKEVYENAKNQLEYVSRTFENYTLHNEKHILNVLDAIAGLLGDRITTLTVGEAELLILVASLHDVGMVYTDDEEKSLFENEQKCREFLNTRNPNLINTDPVDWDKLLQQDYLRWQHPFRVAEVLKQDTWKQIFDCRPKSVATKDTIIAVCQSHGEDRETIKSHSVNTGGKLRYMSARDDGYDPLFCAILLRLGDVLDFDDTRTPHILYTYAGISTKSREEWDKHMASGGFNYPVTPSEKELPYYAECTNPKVERAIHNFLDWIDEEFSNSRDMQRLCCDRWRNFPFPYKVKRDEINREGYDYGNFKLTMDQEQILKLLMGENLYDSNDVFIRELLQNSIDATLLRGKMQPDFDIKSEKARIDLWEWLDSDGKLWFRIDDRGTGMTKGMMERYLLKVGNSYYNSTELVRDLRDNGQNQDYTGIGRFGIGFLSCFLCGINAQISTLYFDKNKCKREEGVADGYGLRMSIDGLTSYYVMQNQVIENNVPKNSMPAPKFCEVTKELENNNYRTEPGTTIVLSIDPGKLGALNLKEAAENLICGTCMPIYYNGERIGLTYDETMAEAHRFAGRRIYELSLEEKERYDSLFPKVAGKYPNIITTTIPLDCEEYRVLDGFSGVLLKFEVHFDDEPMWAYEDYNCDISVDINTDRSGQIFIYFCKREQIPALGPKWISTGTGFNVPIMNRGPKIKLQTPENRDSITLYYNGILCGQLNSSSYSTAELFVPLIFLEEKWRPETDIGRKNVTSLHLDVLLAIFSIFSYSNCCRDSTGFVYPNEWRLLPLSEWRKVNKKLGDWIWKTQDKHTKYADSFLLHFEECKEDLDVINLYKILGTYLAARFQDMYTMFFLFDEDTWEQTIEVTKKGYEKYDDAYNFFPPLMFCHAADESSRRYLCSDDIYTRNCINIDHPFSVWLLENAEILNTYFNRQFKQIIESLRYRNDAENVYTINNIRKQLMSFSDLHGIDMRRCPKLTEYDFYYTEV